MPPRPAQKRRRVPFSVVLLIGLVIVAVILILAAAVWWVTRAARLEDLAVSESQQANALLASYRTQVAKDPSRGIVAVWCMHGGSFARQWLEKLLPQAFPTATIMFTADVDMHRMVQMLQQQQQQQQQAAQNPSMKPIPFLSLLFISSFPSIDPLQPPREVRRHMRKITWNGESYDVKGQDDADVRLVAARPAEVQAQHPYARVCYVSQAWLTPEVHPQHFRQFWQDDVTTRPVMLGFMQSNCKAFRDSLFYGMSKRLKQVVDPTARVEARGRCGRTGIPGMPALSFKRSGAWDDGSWARQMSDCRFILAAENEVGVPGYVTEKLVNAFLAGAIPIYWGDDATVKAWFNPAAFVNVGDYDSPEAAIDAVIELAQDPERMRAMRAAPVLRDHAAMIGTFTWQLDQSHEWQAVLQEIHNV